MERLQGAINPYYIGEHLDANLECCSLGQGFVSSQSLRLGLEDPEEEEGDSHFSTTSSLSLDDKMPFLQMLQSRELPPFFPSKEPTFQTLLKLQQLKKPYTWDGINPCLIPGTETTSNTHQAALELESCVTPTYDTVDPFHFSSVKSESFDFSSPQSSCLEIEGVSVSQPNNIKQDTNILVHPTRFHSKKMRSSTPPVIVTREKRKRKRTRPTKNLEEMESQRMTHIAVERNRRRLMNEHLSSLRALMPPSCFQRGDQASIIGGAIDFVKELEQLMQSLEAQKRMRRAEEPATSGTVFTSSTPNKCPINGSSQSLGNGEEEEGAQVRRRLEVAEIEVTVIRNHVNLKVHCQRRAGQLSRAIVALEELRLTILHLNVTASLTRVLFTFNLKTEEGCKLGSADEVATAVHQIFSSINGS